MEGRNNRRKGILLPSVVFQLKGSPSLCGSYTCVRLYPHRLWINSIISHPLLSPSLSHPIFNHHFLDRLAITMILSDWKNKQPACVSIQEILRTPNRAKVAACRRNPRTFAGSQPGALLQSAWQLNTKLWLNTTLWLTIETLWLNISLWLNVT